MSLIICIILLLLPANVTIMVELIYHPFVIQILIIVSLDENDVFCV